MNNNSIQLLVLVIINDTDDITFEELVKIGKFGKNR